MDAPSDCAGELSCQRHLFEVDDDLSYFDCAAVGPLLRNATALGIDSLRKRATPWVLTRETWFGPAEERRALFAQLINCAPDDVALVPSTSYAAAVCAKISALAPDDVILTIADEFPSTRQTWQALSNHTGANVRIAEREANETWTEAVIRALRPNIKLIAVPTVRWTDGACLDVEKIGRAARTIGAILFIDATQSLGALSFDIETVRPDFVAASGYKWLLGPHGHSYLYVAPEFQEGIPLEENWISREGAEDFARLAEPRHRYRRGARRFDAGQQAASELGSVACAALRQIDDWGVSHLSCALGQITDRIARCAKTFGLTVVDSQSRAPHIISILTGPREDLPNLLQSAKVRASTRGPMLRLSPHLFVDEHDLCRVERLLQTLAETGKSCQIRQMRSNLVP